MAGACECGNGPSGNIKCGIAEELSASKAKLCPMELGK